MATMQATISNQQAADLVARAQGGNQQAFADLYEAYRPLVYWFVRRRLDGADEIAEDLTEDVFVKLYEKLDRYVERGLPFTAWLYRIAQNQLVDYLRKQRKYYALPLEAAAAVALSETSAEYRSVLDRETLEPALARLTPQQRQAVELRFLQDMSVPETASSMGRSEDAVKKLQARALVNLRRVLRSATAPRHMLSAA